MNSNKTFGEAILVMGKSKWGDYSREKEEEKEKKEIGNSFPTLVEQASANNPKSLVVPTHR